MFELNLTIKSVILQYDGQRAKFELNLTFKKVPPLLERERRGNEWSREDG